MSYTLDDGRQISGLSRQFGSVGRGDLMVYLGGFRRVETVDVFPGDAPEVKDAPIDGYPFVLRVGFGAGGFRHRGIIGWKTQLGRTIWWTK